VTVIPEGIPAVQEIDAAEAVRTNMAAQKDIVVKSVIVWIALEVVHIALSVWIAERWKS
jgi:hypothetical protein